MMSRRELIMVLMTDSGSHWHTPSEKDVSHCFVDMSADRPEYRLLNGW